MTLYCLYICGLILSCICFRVAGSSEDLTVNQSPPNIIVNEGDSAQITCCWNNIQHKVKVSWFINETKLSGLSGVKEELQFNQIQNCSILQLTNILKNNTGRYVCQVTKDIPFLLMLKGTGTDLSIRVSQLQKTTTDNVNTVFNPPTTVPFRLPADSSSRDVAMIYILRSLPFICLLMAFFYLNRDNKRATVSKPGEHTVESREGPEEDLEAGETQRNETEVSEQEKERNSTEKSEVAAAATEEEEKTVDKETAVVVDFEKGLSAIHDNESKIVSVQDTAEKTNLKADVEDVTVSVLDSLISAL